MKILLNDYEFPLSGFNRNTYPTDQGMQSSIHITFAFGIGEVMSQLNAVAATTITDVKIKNGTGTTIYHLEDINGRMSVNEYLVDETIAVSADISLRAAE